LHDAAPRRNPESPHNATYACTIRFFKKSAALFTIPYDRFRIIDRNSKYPRGVLRTIYEMEHLHNIMSEKKKKSIPIGNVLFVYILQSLSEAQYSYYCMNAIHNRFKCLVLQLARSLMKIESTRLSRMLVFRMNDENYRRGDCIEHTTDVLHIFCGKIQNRFNEYANRYTLFRVRTKQ